MKQLSEWLTLEQATKSDVAIKRGIANVPNEAQERALANLGKKIYDPVCDKFGRVTTTSVFRSAALNRAIGGSRTSQHCTGEAMDLDVPINGFDMTNRGVFDFIKDNLEFDQLIWEFGSDTEPDWVHVSIRANGKNRKQVLRATRNKGIKYSIF
jgi:hypothetical protein